MCVHGEEVNSGRVDSGNNEVCSDVSLVSEKVLLEHSHTGDYSWLATGGESMELKVGGDDGGGELSAALVSLGTISIAG